MSSTRVPSMILMVLVIACSLQLGQCFLPQSTQQGAWLQRRGMTMQQQPADIGKKISTALLTTMLTLGSVMSAAPLPSLADAIPVVGTNAPDFTLPSNYGKDISLTDLKGKRTVLYFYPGDFTAGCTVEAKSFERDLPQFEALNTQVIGVSVDSVDKHLDFKKKYGLDFPLLSDQGGAVSNKYGSLLDLGFIGKFSNRQTYVISPELKVEYVFTDVDSHVAEHSQQVLSKLKTLSATTQQ